ncbi:hypothetical protein BC834DRAFT_347536 [Gloeopeniophorella convolvens]|nr:hypothetical protein BC834DRAFT_347536 [Gloeopeniophorella convolvens]
MHLSSAFVLLALSLLSSATPTPGKPAPSGSGLAIPISKRDNFRRADGSFDLAALQQNAQNSIAKVRNGFVAYERNTGSPHPLAADLRPLRKRGTGAIPLSQQRDAIWWGLLMLGRPPKPLQWTLILGAATCSFLPRHVAPHARVIRRTTRLQALPQST